jgi:diguanylate cyclase (GGDEF)-like protein
VSEGDQPLDSGTDAELRRLAYRDHLTGLPNRLAMSDRIEAGLARSRREGTSTALLFVDIDGFKRVNDTLGHVAGDELLRLVAARLRALGDDRITAGRHGGDEFLLLVDDLPRDQDAVGLAIEHVGQRLVAMLQEPFNVAGATFELSASAGASVYPHDADSHHELIEHADESMYLAKRRGRGQVAVFERSERRSLAELEATRRVRQGLAHDELELHYQPVIDIANGGGLGGLEALLRWRDPDRGLVRPDDFLPFIEESSLSQELGEWVFSEVCRQLAEWRSRSFDPRVSVNMPLGQVNRSGFVDFMIRTATRRGADLTRMAIEITETGPIELDEVGPTLKALCDAGIVLALDDFGTGHSSLARLRSLPFTLLKTDRSFMSGIPGDPVAEELLEGIIALGKALRLSVIVEGVETAEQVEALLRVGCRMAQGYHLGSPEPPEAIEARWSPARASQARPGRPTLDPGANL